MIAPENVGTPIGGAPGRTVQAVMGVIAAVPGVQVVDPDHYICQFRSLVELGVARSNVRNMVDNGHYWTSFIGGRPSIMKAYIIVPKNSSTITTSMEDFP